MPTLRKLIFSLMCFIDRNIQSFVGHGESINEIRTQALKPSLIVSASKVCSAFFTTSFIYLFWGFNNIFWLMMHSSLLCICEQDESVRLWNVHTGVCILIFAGAGGHRNEVLSVVSEI